MEKVQDQSQWELKTDRLILREVNWDDLEDIFILESNPEVDEYNTLGIPDSKDVTREHLRPFIKDQKAGVRKMYCWTIRLPADDQFIGLAGMNLSADRFKMAEIWYNLMPSHWGNGYATEVARRLIRFGFESLKLHRIEAGVATENKRSIKVLEKAGMSIEGIRRKILPIRGRWVDNYHYAILEDDPWDREPVKKISADENN
jgi:ribosomal-protein-alanine N-acetyltransferase